MVLIPGGDFVMGSNFDSMQGEMRVGVGATETPPHRVILEPFYMDEHEVTNAQFAKFVEETGYVTRAERDFDRKDFPDAPASVPDEAFKAGSFVVHKPERRVDPLAPGANHMEWWRLTPGANWRQPTGPGSNIEGLDDHPVVNVTYEDAIAYAEWAGKRLPTEAEWEYAARGGLDGKIYVWGDELQPGGKWMTNIWQGDFPNENSLEDGHKFTAPVKSFPANGFGLYEMAGNVWEFTSDIFDPDFYKNSPKYCPECETGQPLRGMPGEVYNRVIRGGSFLCAASYCTGYRPAARQISDDVSSSHHTGFRCVKDVE